MDFLNEERRRCRNSSYCCHRVITESEVGLAGPHRCLYGVKLARTHIWQPLRYRPCLLRQATAGLSWRRKWSLRFQQFDAKPSSCHSGTSWESGRVKKRLKREWPVLAHLRCQRRQHGFRTSWKYRAWQWRADEFGPWTKLQRFVRPGQKEFCGR